MNILVCIDDTDNLESRGTGELADELRQRIITRGWGSGSYVSRHQLLIHPDIPYTSHNSSMCFSAELGEPYYEEFVSLAESFLAAASAPGSDPGLCVVKTAELSDSQQLIEFGLLAKQQVLGKSDAYDLADRLRLHLSEHGGSGQGVVGALAGCGLRLSGDDGRLRGWLQFSPRHEVMTVHQLCQHPYVDQVQSLDGRILDDQEKVRIGDRPKSVLKGGDLLLLVTAESENQDGVAWKTCHRRLLKKY